MNKNPDDVRKLPDLLVDRRPENDAARTIKKMVDDANRAVRDAV